METFQSSSKLYLHETAAIVSDFRPSPQTVAAATWRHFSTLSSLDLKPSACFHSNLPRGECSLEQWSAANRCPVKSNPRRCWTAKDLGIFLCDHSYLMRLLMATGCSSVISLDRRPQAQAGCEKAVNSSVRKGGRERIRVGERKINNKRSSSRLPPPLL